MWAPSGRVHRAQDRGLVAAGIEDQNPAARPAASDRTSHPGVPPGNGGDRPPVRGARGGQRQRRHRIGFPGVTSTGRGPVWPTVMTAKKRRQATRMVAAGCLVTLPPGRGGRGLHPRLALRRGRQLRWWPRLPTVCSQRSRRRSGTCPGGSATLRRYRRGTRRNLQARNPIPRASDHAFRGAPSRIRTCDTRFRKRNHGVSLTCAYTQLAVLTCNNDARRCRSLLGVSHRPVSAACPLRPLRTERTRRRGPPSFCRSSVVEPALEHSSDSKEGTP